VATTLSEGMCDGQDRRAAKVGLRVVGPIRAGATDSAVADGTAEGDDPREANDENECETGTGRIVPDVRNTPEGCHQHRNDHPGNRDREKQDQKPLTVVIEDRIDHIEDRTARMGSLLVAQIRTRNRPAPTHRPPLIELRRQLPWAP
jgi:hypothetical protein